MDIDLDKAAEGMLNPFTGMRLPQHAIDAIELKARRLYAKSRGAETRIKAAQDKRDRKAAKRAAIVARHG